MQAIRAFKPDAILPLVLLPTGESQGRCLATLWLTLLALSSSQRQCLILLTANLAVLLGLHLSTCMPAVVQTQASFLY